MLIGWDGKAFCTNDFVDIKELILLTGKQPLLSTKRDSLCRQQSPVVMENI